MNKYKCAVCPYIYDPEKGDPSYGTGNGIVPGTPFEELPDDWFCPDCGGEKALFEVVS